MNRRSFLKLFGGVAVTIPFVKLPDLEAVESNIFTTPETGKYLVSSSVKIVEGDTLYIGGNFTNHTEYLPLATWTGEDWKNLDYHISPTKEGYFWPDEFEYEE